MKEQEILQMISDERERKSVKYGYTNEAILERTEDYGKGELALAAASYCLTIGDQTEDYLTPSERLFPWSLEYFKPTPDDRIKELVKAAAFIVDEIYRLQNINLTQP